MSVSVRRMASLSGREREDALAQAADALRAGRLAVLPTETVYGLACAAGMADAVAALRRARAALGDEAADAPSTWHVASVDEAVEALGARTPLAARVVRVLAPGPVTFLGERPPAELASMRAGAGVAPGVLDDGDAVAVRVPSHLAARDVLRRAGVPVIAERIPRAPAGGPAPARDGDEAADALERAGVDVGAVIDDGPTPLRVPSTVVRLLRDGGYRVEHEGVYGAREIADRVVRILLVVCTGNTCRSPMAEALATAALEAHHPAVPTIVRSAGLGAGRGAPMTPEARAALRTLGIDAGPHASTPLTRGQIDRADRVYAMTRGHLAGILAIAPDAAAKAELIDPDGVDIPDPIGGPQDEYDATALRLREAVERRLKELDA